MYRLLTAEGVAVGTVDSLAVPPGAILIIQWPEGATLPGVESARLKAWFAEQLPSVPVLMLPYGVRFLRLEPTDE